MGPRRSNIGSSLSIVLTKRGDAMPNILYNSIKISYTVSESG